MAAGNATRDSKVTIPVVADIDPPRDLPEDYRRVMLDAVLVALSGRIHVDETSDATPERILHEIWEDHFVLRPAAAAPG